MFWLRRTPGADLLLAGLLVIVAGIEATLVLDFGPQPIYLLNLAIHLGLVLSTAIRRTHVVPSFIGSFALLAALALTIRWSPVNLGVSPALFCAPLALLAITRHGPSPAWGRLGLMLGVAGTFLSPARAGGNPIMAALHLLILTGCYLWAAQQRSLADGYAAALAEQARIHDLRSARAVEAERTQVAREVHDVVAHSLAVVQVQAATALNIGGEARLREALENIRGLTAGALSETRSLVGVLRDRHDIVPAGEMAELIRSVDQARAAGVRLEADIPCPEVLRQWGESLPVRTRITLLRVVQEALTNVLRHGGANPEASLFVRGEGAAIRVEAINRAAPRSQGAPGFGLVGLAERVDLVGGSFDSGRRGDEFRVCAVIPAGDGR